VTHAGQHAGRCACHRVAARDDASSDSDFSQHVADAAETMPVIEQAKGVLLGYRRYSAQQAFGELTSTSQQHNVKLASLARALVNVATGNDHLVDDALWEIVAAHWTWLLVSGPAAGTTTSANRRVGSQPRGASCATKAAHTPGVCVSGW
jgi:hypothetical protein